MTGKVHLGFFALLAALAASAPTAAHDGQAHNPVAATSLPAAVRPAAAVVDAFHAALKRGDTAAALALMSDDVLIYEGGGVERSKAEYAAHHLAADAEFSMAVPSKVIRRSGGTIGPLAWVASEGTTSGAFRGRQVDRTTAETILLHKRNGKWKIAHIHWSSAPAKPAAATAPAVAVTPLLADSVPGNGTTVDRPVRQLELRFARPARLLELVIHAPGATIPIMITAAGENQHFLVPIDGLKAGPHAVDYRVRAGDREERGTFAFTVR